MMNKININYFLRLFGRGVLSTVGSSRESLCFCLLLPRTGTIAMDPGLVKIV